MPIPTRAALLFLAVTSLFVGVWAGFFPESFYGAFPGFGRAWISVDGPFNEHLIRDVGGLSLGEAVLSVLCLRWPSLVSPFAVGLSGLAYNLPHFIFHTSELGLYAPIDQIGNLVALGLALGCSIWLVTPAARLRP